MYLVSDMHRWACVNCNNFYKCKLDCECCTYALSNQPKEKLFILNEKEFLKNKKYIEPVNNWWWLCSPNTKYYNNGISVVTYDNTIESVGCRHNGSGVRPAFKFENDSYTKKPLGTIIHFGKINWIKLKDGIYLAKDILFNYCFDSVDALYNGSDIKKKLKECESWWFTNEELKMMKDVE